MLAGFARYQAEYDVRVARSCHEALQTTHDIVAEGGTVALFASESVLPDAEVLHCFHKLREKVPTARRVIAAHWDRFLTDAPGLRAGMAKGKYDAFLLMPRGVRDEEFHNAITDLLSDWGSTVADPEVVAVKIISPTRDALTLGIRDFLDRMGMPSRVWEPDTEAGRYVLDHWDGEPVYPLVCRGHGTVMPRHQRPRRRDHDVRRADRDRPRARRRRRGRGRRAGRPRGRGVRRLRGPQHGDPRGRGDRRPGRHQLDDPQLPRLPARHLRHAAGPARPQPGAPLRRAVLHRPGRRRAAARLRRRPARAVHRQRRGARPLRRDLQRRRLPQAPGRAARGRWSASASTTARR